VLIYIFKVEVKHSNKEYGKSRRDHRMDKCTTAFIPKVDCSSDWYQKSYDGQNCIKLAELRSPLSIVIVETFCRKTFPEWH